MTQSKIIRGLLPDTTYDISVRASIKWVKGLPATIEHTTVALPTVSAPTDIKAVPFPLIECVIISWDVLIKDSNNIPRYDIAHYEIFRRSYPNSDPYNWDRQWTDFTDDSEPMAKCLTSFFIDTGRHKAYWSGGVLVKPYDVQKDYTYQYGVRAVTNGGEKGTFGLSDYANVGRPSPPTIYPSSFTFNPNDVFALQGEGKLNFVDETGLGAEYYEIQASMLRSGSYLPYVFKGFSYHSGAPNAWQTAEITLLTGESYKLRARAFNGVLFYSDWSNSASVTCTDTEAPAAITDVDADVTGWNKNVHLNWSPIIVTDLKRYRIYELRSTSLAISYNWSSHFTRSNDIGYSTSTKKIFSSTSSSYVRTYNSLVSDYGASVVNSSHFFYWVAGEDVHGNWSSPGALNPNAYASMGAPDPVSVTISSELVIDIAGIRIYNLNLEWPARANADLGYHLKWRQSDKAGYWNWWIPETGNTPVKATLFFIQEDKLYDIAVRAGNLNGWSNWWEVTSYVVPPDTTAPDPPVSPVMGKWFQFLVIRTSRTAGTVRHNLYVDGTTAYDGFKSCPSLTGWMYQWITFPISEVMDFLGLPESSSFGSHVYYISNVDGYGNESTKTLITTIGGDKLALERMTDLSVGGGDLTVDPSGSIDVEGDIYMRYGSDIRFYGNTGSYIGSITSVTGTNILNISSESYLRLYSSDDISLYASDRLILSFGGNSYTCAYGTGGYLRLDPYP